MKACFYAETVTQLVLFPAKFDSRVFFHPEMMPLKTFSAATQFLQAKVPFDFFQFHYKTD